MQDSDNVRCMLTKKSIIINVPTLVLPSFLVGSSAYAKIMSTLTNWRKIISHEEDSTREVKINHQGN